MLKRGDRIIVTRNSGKAETDMTGEVISVEKGDPSNLLSINFDEYMHGHSCGGRCENGHGWNIREEYVKRIDDKEY